MSTGNRAVLASRNVHKLAELQRILAGAVPGWEVVDLTSLPLYPETPETGATFAENALLKARDAVAHTGLPAFADDSGLQVDALNGMPGVLSARWAGPVRDDAANLQLVLAQLEEVPVERRGAAFVCAAAWAFPDGSEGTVQGRVDGLIVREPRGTNGFGYDPIFVPEGLDRTSAELSAAEKDAISHRGKAFRELARILRERG